MSAQTAIVTGGAGFIGSHVVDALLAQGDRVVVIDDLSSGDATRLADEASLELIDIVDSKALDALIDLVAPQVIYHLAAQSSVTVSVTDPVRDCDVNVGGTLNLLQAATRHRAPVVFTSTGGALYGNDAPIPTTEDRLPAPLAPYGASKWAGEAYLSTWSRASGVGHAICRLGNVYGPRQSPHGEAGVVAIFSYKLWRGETPTLFGHGRPSRDYVHVADVVDGLLKASGRSGVFNIAAGIETPVADVLDALQSAAGTSIEPTLAPLRAGELERSCMDPARAASVLGWEPQVELAEGLRSTYHALTDGFRGAAPHAPPPAQS